MIKKKNVTMLLVLSATAVLTRAQLPEPDLGRFTEQIEAFMDWDQKNSFPEEGIVFVGSASIRRWATASAFPNHSVINRGFDGAHISDVGFYYEQIVKPYSPAIVVLFAGGNDIVGGKSPERVLADFQSFSRRVQADLSDTRILFLAIKPSFARWRVWPTFSEANRLIKDFVGQQPNLTYVDVATPLLNEDGQPKDVFIRNGLHLNESGYLLWKEVLEPYLH